MNDLNDRLQRLFGGRRGGGIQPGLYAVAAGALFVLWALSGIFIIQANEVGVITRFGAYHRTADPGLHIRLPSPIEGLQRVQVTTLRQTDVGGRSGSGEATDESGMITSDQSIVNLDFTVQWRVVDPVKYLFNLQAPDEAIRAIAESSMREVVGRTELYDVLTRDPQVQRQTLELMQQTLDANDSGMSIVEVQLRSANPPAPVVPAYQNLQQANQEAQALINQGNAYRNRVVNEAQGDAQRIRAAAEGYQQQVILLARGQAARFNLLYDQYRANPGVTRQRMYLETMERILARTNKVVIDARGATAPIILPPDVFRPRQAAPPAPQPAPQPAQPAAQGAAQ